MEKISVPIKLTPGDMGPSPRVFGFEVPGIYMPSVAPVVVPVTLPVMLPAVLQVVVPIMVQLIALVVVITVVMLVPVVDNGNKFADGGRQGL
jgi:hypothetical protein